MKICFEEVLIEKVPGNILRELGAIAGRSVVEGLTDTLTVGEVEEKINRELEKIGEGKISIYRDGKRGVVEVLCENECVGEEFFRGLVEVLVDHLFPGGVYSFEDMKNGVKYYIEGSKKTEEATLRKIEFLRKLWNYSFSAREMEVPPFPGDKLISPPFDPGETLKEFRKNTGLR